MNTSSSSLGASSAVVDPTPVPAGWLRRMRLLCWLVLGWGIAPLPAQADWDLRFEILNAPSVGVQCGFVNWAIRVRNVGNSHSENVCFFTGISQSAGASNWVNTIQHWNFSSGNIAPGDSRTFYINNYPIFCNAFLGTQYIKVEINYWPGRCYDLYFAGNYAQAPIRIEAPFWDLRFELLNPPTLGLTCSQVDWTVRVSNVGNFPSANVCFFTGIERFSGAGVWQNTLQFVHFWSGQIPPGGSDYFRVDNYSIPCGTANGQWWVKAEINYNPGGCRDDFMLGNFVQAPVQILNQFWDLQLEVLHTPLAAFQCEPHVWEVRVRNVGTVLSDNVCVTTGLSPSPGATHWAGHLGQISFQPGRLAAGASTNFSVTNYSIGCDASATLLYLKALIEPVAAGNCARDPRSAGNYVERALPVYPPSFILSQASFQVGEEAGFVQITVEKHSAGEGSVEYFTADGTAVAPVGMNAGDYTPASGRLVFTPDEREKSFFIPIAQDTVFESNHFFFINLTNATGPGLAVPSRAYVTIMDDDVASTESVLTAFAPGPRGPATGRLSVDATPAGVSGAWQLCGDVVWRPFGAVLTNLVAGLYEVLFRQSAQYVVEDGLQAEVVGATHTNVTAVYHPSDPREGVLSVRILPSEVATNPVAGARGQWRLWGETTFRDQGELAVVPGRHVAEFKPVAGRATPPSRVLVVPERGQVANTVTYAAAPPLSGEAPRPVAYSQIAGGFSAGHPYPFCGMVVTEFGFGSGVLVKSNVVLTAAHLLFDPDTGEQAKSVKWFFQRHDQAYFAPPLVPRGWRFLPGLEEHVRAEGVASLRSTNGHAMNVAALYFSESAGLGGYGGYLVSDAAPDEWLSGSRDMTLAGYPMDGIPVADRGLLHATQPDRLRFTGQSPPVYVTTDAHGRPGMEGGPLCVRTRPSMGSRRFFPAAVFLGGPGQGLFRVIDREVAALINAAEIDGHNWTPFLAAGFTGVLYLGDPSKARSTSEGWLDITLRPDDAVRAGGGLYWGGAPNQSYSLANASFILIPGLRYSMQFLPVPGYTTPDGATNIWLSPGASSNWVAAYKPVVRLQPLRDGALAVSAPTAGVYRLEFTNRISSAGASVFAPWPVMREFRQYQLSNVLSDVWLWSNGPAFYRVVRE